MSHKLTNVTCRYCGKQKLSERNTSKDNLCGYCQRELTPHHPNSTKYRAWVAAGRPPKKKMNGTPQYAHVEEDTVEQAAEFGMLWDKRLLKIATVDFLKAAAEELTRRREQVEKDAHALGLRFRRSR